MFTRRNQSTKHSRHIHALRNKLPTANETQVFDRKLHGGFPEITFLKQLIRDQVNPEKNLGHSDKKKSLES